MFSSTTPTVQATIENNSSLWPKVESLIKSVIRRSCFYKDMHEDVLSETKILFLLNNKNKNPSVWFLKKTVLFACRNLGLYRPKSKQDEQTQSISFASLETLQENGFDIADTRYTENKETDRLNTLLEYALTDPTFVKAVALIKEGHDLSAVAKREGISCSGLWQFLRREGQKTLQEIESPQMRLISANEVKVKAKSRPVTTKSKASTSQQLPLFAA
ncbi:hypothetical protein DOJK_00597 [Patescibacteria group bacterium]|uniref:hypothetical protein n=1 Tax=Geobacter sp. TaxID=46610 RepID=UPI001AC811EB|nr:hypothetical protein [Geobacter sp.]CAG1020823.1 hypothetical protein DOJK_00597 [Patescibacteria group bacterium]